ncbi:hypothetical protein, partial [Humitalea rosea]|uniref:hypothetical protein n=1 Tax=Humitalea rosea TaxID=990373 RepID=UPI001B866DA3
MVLLGATISFRPPRCFRTTSGTRTVSICAAPVMLPYPFSLRAEGCEAVGAQAMRVWLSCLLLLMV